MKFTAAVAFGAVVAYAQSMITSAVAQTSSDDIITRDVCIIGGGSSGTYAAVQLRDSGKSVVVVEKEDVLGGNTNTYTDPTTGQTVDYGVVVFHNLPIVQNYFSRFDVPLTVLSPSASSGGETSFVDTRTGQVFPKFSLPNPTEALEKYAEQLAKYPALENGFYLPDPVPEDLMLPFGQFAQKFNLSDMVFTASLYGQGYGNFAHQTTLYVFKIFGLGILQALQTGFLTTADQDNHEIYDKALQFLGSDVLLQSHVISTDRSAADHVTIVVQTPSGRKTIQAKKLLISIPPKLDNFVGFDLSANERSLFGKWLNTGYYTSLLNNTGIPNDDAVINIGTNTPFNLPQLPGVYGINPTVVPGLFDVKYGSPFVLPDDVVKADIISSIQRLKYSGVATSTDEPEFVAYKGHIPFALTVPPEAIKDGFYTKLYALQGCRNTYYTGAAFHTQDSSLLWQFTEALLPDLEK
jgi:hypothetical protein